MDDLKLMVTLWPSFPHFKSFLNDSRLSGIRLNSAMMALPELEGELAIIKAEQRNDTIPLFYDIKGRQLRIEEVIPSETHLEIRLNHPVSVSTPTPVLFKAGADVALLESIEDEGYRLVFRGGPKYSVRAGESLHIRHPSLKVGGTQFTDLELAKISRVKEAGLTKWFLSYVESQRDVDEFLELVGRDADVMLKIESKRGLEYVATEFKKRDNLTLVTARGDLYVELDLPHEVLAAQKMIVAKDPKACVASRLLLSIVRSPVPSCTDFSELAWLYDIGYRNIMLCDELCLKDEFLGPAVAAFDAFRNAYVPKPTPVELLLSMAIRATEATRRSSLDRIFNQVEEWVKEDNWRALNDFVEGVAKGVKAPDMMLGILTATLPWKGSLLHRQSLIRATKEQLRHVYGGSILDEVKIDRALAGLE